MENMKVKAGRGLRESYDAIPDKDPNKVYYCKDTQEIFLGDLLMSSVDELNKVKDQLSTTSGNIGDMEELEFDADSLVSAVNQLFARGGGSYNDLVDKPSINGTELVQGTSFAELGDVPLTNSQIKSIVDTQYRLIFG